jgi:pilus assembly protein CpaE
MTSLASERGTRGQATVELVGALPLAVAVALAAAQLLAAGAARELAGHAAEAGAAAILQETSAPADAARDALPGWSKDRAEIDVSGRRVRVRLRPLAVVPGVADELAATVVADAGPER